ncbi:hypothetical protein TNCV_1219791 [Trichonephila clavipes]|nr:hypothetical protein TNCV_1219791 [Trichonephila clavipes]
MSACVEAWPPPQPLFDCHGICSHRPEDETRELQERRMLPPTPRMGWREGNASTQGKPAKERRDALLTERENSFCVFLLGANFFLKKMEHIYNLGYETRSLNSVAMKRVAQYHLIRGPGVAERCPSGSEIPPAALEHERASPKAKLFCAVSSSNILGPFLIH